jgi:signal transduction histidine kinase
MANIEQRSPFTFGLRTKLALGFVGLLAILIAVGVESISLLSELGGSIDVILRENYVSVIACEQMKESLERLDSGALFALAGEVEKGQALAAEHRPHFESALQKELHDITLPGERERAERLRQLYAAYGPTLDRVLAVETPASERHALYFSRLDPVFQQIKSTADEILQMNQRNMVEANDRARHLAAAASRQMAVLLLAGVAFAGFCVFFLSRSILGPLEGLVRAAREVESGDLMTVPVDRKVEERLPGTVVEDVTGRRRGSRIDTSPDELIGAAVQKISAAYRAKRVSLVSGADSAAARVLVDPEGAKLVFSSLLRNALAHTPEGGTVTVRAEGEAGRVRFTVTDTGRGIPAAHREEIFEPFHQVPGTEDLGGVGLGLATARDIVQAHGGEIHCDSEEGKGTTFWLTLPAAVDRETFEKAEKGI